MCALRMDYFKLKSIYITFFMIMLIFRNIGAYSLIPSIADNCIFFFLAVIGFFISMYRLKTEKITWNSEYKKYLILFLCVLIVSCFINMKYGIFSNAKTVIWTLIYFILLYSGDKDDKDLSVSKEFSLIQRTFIWSWFILSLFSIFMFLIQFNFTVFINQRTLIRIGYVESRLFGVYGDPNYAAVMAFIGIIMSTFSLLDRKKSMKNVFKSFFVLNIIIQTIYISLSGSRTAFTVMALILPVATFYMLYGHFASKRTNICLNLILSVFSAIIASICVFVFIYGIKEFMSYIPPVINKLIRVGEYKLTEKISVIRHDVADSEDISNLRFKIWKSAFEIFKAKPFFGTSPRNMISYAKSNLPNTFIAQRNYMVHNSYIDTLVSVGIIGAIPMFIFYVKHLQNVLKYYFKKEYSEINLNVDSMVLCAASIAISGLFLSEILFVNTVGSILFWLFLGRISNIVQIKNNKSLSVK